MMPAAILLVLVAALAGQVLWGVLRRQPQAGRPVAAAALVALAGYAVTGSPGRGDRPAAPRAADTGALAAFEETRRQSLTIAGDTAAWLTLAEALEAGGRTADAVAVLNEALHKSPRSPDLWIGLATALVVHADGALTPAARLAYARGEALAPARPELRRLRELSCRRQGGPCG